MSFTRREFTGLAVFTALAWITRSDAWTREIPRALQRWILRLGEIGHAVQTDAMAPGRWQEAMQELYAGLSPEELVTFIDMDRLIAGLSYPKEKLGAVVNVPWPQVDGFPATLQFGHKLFVYRQGAVTPPHVHNHLVSAHWVLRGEIRARTYDRVQDLETSVVLRPTRDEVARPGALITMSDERDNGHWFEGVGPQSISFDIPIGDITPRKQYRHPAEAFNQIYVDPTVAPQVNGTIDAPIIPFRDSVRKFGGVGG